jgi:starch phosphorylase
MVREYTDRFYLPLAEKYQGRAVNGAQSGRSLSRWLSRLNDLWPKIHIARVNIENREAVYFFSLQIYLGDLTEQDVRVELFAEPTEGDTANIHEMHIDHALPGAVNGFVYNISIPAKRPVSDYTPRIIPSHPDACIPDEAQPILWVK